MIPELDERRTSDRNCWLCLAPSISKLSHTPTVNCGVCGVKWASLSPLGDADISSFEDEKPILCYDNSSLFSNLYQNFHLTIMLPNGDREEALNWGDIVTAGQTSIGYSWILAQNDNQPHWHGDSGFDRETMWEHSHAKELGI
jgi:hypothetical protein